MPLSRADGLGQLALEGAVVAQARQRVVIGLDHHRAVRLGVAHRDRRLRREQLDELELVLREVRIRRAHPADVERADHVAPDEQRADDHGLGLERRARDLDRARVQVGVVREERLAMLDRPAGHALVERPLVLEDQLREPVAGDDRAANPRGPVGAIDRHVSYATTVRSESAIFSRTSVGSSVDIRCSLTSSSRRWLSRRCRSSACWDSRRANAPAFAIACAA